MILQTNIFRQFFQYAKHIKSSSILPIHEYIELRIHNGKGKLTKTNIGAYVQMSFDTDLPDAVLLIEENSLLQFLSSKSETLEFAIEDKTVTIKDGSYEQSYTLANNADFKQFDDKLEHIATLDETTINRLVTAAGLSPKVDTWMGSVHLDKQGVLGTTEHSFMYFNSPMDISLVLDATNAKALAEFTELKYMNFDKFDVFVSDNVTFGFVRGSFNTPNYSTHLNAPTNNSFTISRALLLDYCVKTCNVVPDKKDLTCSLSIENNMLTLSMNDAGKGKKNNFTIPLEHEDTSKVHFVAPNMRDYLRTLPFANLKIAVEQNRFVITTDEDTAFKGTFMFAKI